MYDQIAVIGEKPPIFRNPLNPRLDLKTRPHSLNDRIQERVQHPLARAGADHKIIGDNSNFLDIQQDDIFPLLFFKYIDDRPRDFD
jgi:hypothetical protein